MVEIRRAEPRAGGAIALFKEWLMMVAPAPLLDIDPPIRREERAISGEARRQHAVEKIDSARNSHPEILRRADAHQVARLACGQMRSHDLEHFSHDRFRLSDRKPADRAACHI